MYQLRQRQGLPLDCKIRLSQNRIRHWYEQWAGQCYVAFSGGKDSTVLLDLAREMYPDVPAVFVDTGLEYPEIKTFVKKTSNVGILRPKQTFRQVIEHHGYPVISKQVADAVRRIRSPGCSQRTKDKALYGDERGTYGRLPKKWHFLLETPFKISDKCCEVLKMRPVIDYYKRTGRVGIVGTMASDSNKRTQAYLKHGCFVMNKTLPKCTPMAFWSSDDVWQYIRERNLPYCPIYDTGVEHTGCIYCMFGVHFEPEPNRFQRMQHTHPKLYDYCMNDLGLSRVLAYLKIPIKSAGNYEQD
jgi:3'-phosphoadenosine 5'-phosphosulfate sulfotransferase (PAPS reductase)/FAD synthetase